MIKKQGAQNHPKSIFPDVSARPGYIVHSVAVENVVMGFVDEPLPSALQRRSFQEKLPAWFEISAQGSESSMVQRNMQQFHTQFTDLLHSPR
eukprot:g30020.t1